MADIESKNAAELSAVKEFHLPRYAELPNFGLYLEQALKVINEALSPVISEPLTKPMMNNYVKNGVVVLLHPTGNLSHPGGLRLLLHGIRERPARRVQFHGRGAAERRDHAHRPDRLGPGDGARGGQHRLRHENTRALTQRTQKGVSPLGSPDEKQRLFEQGAASVLRPVRALGKRIIARKNAV